MAKPSDTPMRSRFTSWACANAAARPHCNMMPKQPQQPLVACLWTPADTRTACIVFATETAFPTLQPRTCHVSIKLLCVHIRLQMCSGCGAGRPGGQVDTCCPTARKTAAFSALAGTKYALRGRHPADDCLPVAVHRSSCCCRCVERGGWGWAGFGSHSSRTRCMTVSCRPPARRQSWSVSDEAVLKWPRIRTLPMR